MTLMAWGLIALVILPATFLVWSLLAIDRRSVIAVQTNLGRISYNGDGRPPSRAPIFLGLARRLTPGSYEARLDKLLATAGRPLSLPLEKMIVGKPLLALAGFGFGVFVFSKNPSAGMAFFTLGLTVLGYFGPDLMIYNSGIKRQQAIELELPNTLDQMLIAVEAGLGFEAAMARTAENGKGPLAEEFMRTLQDIQVGRSRGEAYQAMAERSTVQDLKSFVRAVVQADKYGIGLATVLRTQANQMRVKRRQRAEEKAMKIPVKVIFPLILFIFPVLFIVIMGPAAIRLMDAFS
ncbi:type II secretion system F family protein [Arthrobacter sp. CAU 1506]|nr:type II secretion system F family protein [Arthrobacter sp. CAU 1506]TJY71522.1 type II secretion system F family protein [Arthrobacter sp. CAU 1506]